MPWNIIEPCGESATTQFGFISGSLFQNFTAANIHCSGDELPSDPNGLNIGSFSCDGYIGISIDNVLNIVTSDCESQAACYEFEAVILSLDCLQDGSLAVCSTGDKKIHFIIGNKLISQSTGEMFDDGISRSVVQIKLSEPIEQSSFHDLWILFEDGQLFCKRQIDTSLLKSFGSEDLSPAALLSVQSHMICVPLPHPWITASGPPTDRSLTAVPFGACMTAKGVLAIFDWADNEPSCCEHRVSTVDMEAMPRRAAYLPLLHCLLLLDAEGHLVLFDLNCQLFVQRWQDWDLEDFIPLPSLSNDDETVLAVVRCDTNNRFLEIRSLPDLRERTFSVQISPGPVAMFPLAFDLGPLAFLSCWEAWASAEAGLSLKVLMEMNPTSKMMRLLARQRFEEAEELATAFKLDQQIILVHKMARLISLPLDQALSDKLFACFEAIEVLPKHPDLVRACLEKTFPLLEMQHRFLETLVKKLQTDGPISAEWEKAADLLQRLQTFQAWDPPLEFTVNSWSAFSRIDPYNKFMEALTLNQLKNAFLLWDRHHLDLQKGFLRFGDRAVEDLMSFADHFGLESPLVDWLLTEFLPMAVSSLPPSCLTVFANAYRTIVEAVEERHPDRWPQLAIAALERLFVATSRDRLCAGNLASEHRAWLLSQLGAGPASPLWDLQLLQERLERLQLLRERYGFELRLQEVGSASSAAIAALLLEKELRFGRRLQRALERSLRPFLQSEGLEESDFLKQFVTGRVCRLRREVEAAEVQRLSEEAVGALSLLPFSSRMRLLLDLATALVLPWPSHVAAAVDAAVEEAALTGGEVALAAHPLRAELVALRRCHEVHELLTRHGVTLPQTKLDARTAAKAIRILVRRRLKADGGGLDEGVLRDLERIGSEVRITPLDVRRACLHQLISLRRSEAVLAFLDACSRDLQAPLLRSAFCTTCSLLRAAEGASVLQRPRAVVQQDVELALCLGERLWRLGDQRAAREVAVLHAMMLLLRLREEETWLDQVSEPRWASCALRTLLQAELRRLQEAGPCSDLRPPSSLRVLARYLQRGGALPADFDFTAAWLQGALAFGAWGLRAVLHSLQPALWERRAQDAVSWLRPLSLLLLQAIEEEEEEERGGMLRQLAEAWAEAEGSWSEERPLALRICTSLQNAITERATKFKALSPEAELRMLCRFSVEDEDRIPASVTQSELHQLLGAAFAFARSAISGAAGDEDLPLTLVEGLLDCGLVLSCGWSLLHRLSASGLHDPARIEALWVRLNTHCLPRVLFDLLSSRRLDPIFAYGVARELGFESANVVIGKVVQRAPNSYKLARVVSKLTYWFGSTTGHEKSKALAARFCLVAEWLQRLVPFKADFGTKLLRNADINVLEAVIAAGAAEEPPAELSVPLLCDFCADFKLDAHRFLPTFLEKLLCWSPDLVLKSPSSVEKRLALARSALTFLLERSKPAALDSLSEWLTAAFNETDSFDYERLGFILEHGPKRPDASKCLELLAFLKSWRRVGPVSRKELDWFNKRTNLMPLVFSEELALSPLAKTRLPFFAMLEAPEDIIEAEINPDTVGELIEYKSVLNMMPDVMVVVAAKNLITSHVAWTNRSGAPNRLAWTGPASEVDYAVWEKLMELLSIVEQPKLAFAGVQALVRATRSGWEHCMALDACDRFADQWLAAAVSGSEQGLAQRVTQRFKVKREEVALEGALREHSLATPETLALLQRPADLVQHLLEGSAGPQVDARCKAAEKIAALRGVDVPSVMLRLLRKWLRCADDSMAGDDLDVTFNYRDWREEVQSQASSEERWLPPGADADHQRAVALLRQNWAVPEVRHFVEEVAFGLEEGSLAQLRALSGMLLAWPLPQVRAAADRLLPLQLRFAGGQSPPLQDFLTAVIYLCRLEPVRPLPLEEFLAADKALLARQWLSDHRFAADSLVTTLALQLLLDFRPEGPQLWAEALRLDARCRGARIIRRSLSAAAWLRVQELGADLRELEQD